MHTRIQNCLVASRVGQFHFALFITLLLSLHIHLCQWSKMDNIGFRFNVILCTMFYPLSLWICFILKTGHNCWWHAVMSFLVWLSFVTNECGWRRHVGTWWPIKSTSLKCDLVSIEGNKLHRLSLQQSTHYPQDYGPCLKILCENCCHQSWCSDVLIMKWKQEIK